MSHVIRSISRRLAFSGALRLPADVPKSGGNGADMAGIHEAAVKFVERFGDKAITEAGIRATELLHVGDYDGRTRWQLIQKEVSQLLQTEDLIPN